MPQIVKDFQGQTVITTFETTPAMAFDLIEALERVRAQRGPPRLAVVIVVDGCPMPESDRVAQRYVLAHPGRVR